MESTISKICGSSSPIKGKNAQEPEPTPPRVTLVLPRSKVHRSSAISMSGAEHLGLGSIAAHLRRTGANVTILNFQLGAFFNAWDGLLDDRESYETVDLAREILLTNPDIVGFCVTSMTLADAVALARLVKDQRKDCMIGFGGPHAILCAQELFERFQEIDFIGLHDGERSFASLVEDMRLGRWPRSVPDMLIRDRRAPAAPALTSDKSFSRSIVDLPMPVRDDLISMAIRAPVTEARLTTSRGCTHQCAFCIDAKRYNRRWYARTAEQVLDEMEQLSRCLGIRHFWISDDNFVTGARASLDRAVAIAEGLLERGLDITYRARFRSDTFSNAPGVLQKLAQSGLVCAYVGIEAGSQPQLNRFRKETTVEQHKQIVEDLRSYEIALQIGFIMFEPYSSFEDLYESAQFLRQIDEMYVVGNFIQSLDLFPGAGFVQDLQQDGLIHPDFGAVAGYDAYDFKVPQIGRLAKYLEMSHDEETITRDKWIYRYRTNLLPRYLRELRAIGKQGLAADFKDREMEIIGELNDVNVCFFTRLLGASEAGRPDKVLDAERNLAWDRQRSLLQQYSYLHGRVKDEVERLRAFPRPASLSSGAKSPLPPHVEQWIDEAVRDVSLGPNVTREVLGGGNLNYTVKLTADGESVVFRCYRPDFQELIRDYLDQLYTGAGVCDDRSGFSFRSIPEQVKFHKFLIANGLPAVPVIAHTADWMVCPFIRGRTVAEHLAAGASVSVVLRLLALLFSAHSKDIVYNDRWGSNEMVEESGRICFLDFDVKVDAGTKGLEGLKNAEMAIALFGCLLHAARRDDLLACMRHYGIPLLRRWNYDLREIHRVLTGYTRFYLNRKKPVNQLSPPAEIYRRMAPFLDRLITMLQELP